MIIFIYYICDMFTYATHSPQLPPKKTSKASLRELSSWETSCDEEGGARGDRGDGSRVLGLGGVVATEKRRRKRTRQRNGPEKRWKLENRSFFTSYAVVCVFEVCFFLNFIGIEYFQSLLIVNLSMDVIVLPWWNCKLPTGRMMISQCHRKAIRDTRCWLRGLTAEQFFMHGIGRL